MVPFYYLRSFSERRSSQGWSQRGGGALQAKGLNRVAQGMSGVEYERDGWNPPLIRGGVPGSSPEFFFKIYVSENAFQAILKPLFPYSITSISGSTLSVRTSATFLGCLVCVICNS